MSKPLPPAKPQSLSVSNTVLSCQLCRAPHDDSSHEPKLLPCHHSFCVSCLTQRAQGRAYFRCPEYSCRKKCAVPTGGVEQLQSNFYINQMQSLIMTPTITSGSQQETQGNLCEKHLQQPLLFYCRTCMLPICMNCTVLDHDKNAGHAITDIASIVKENKERMASKLEALNCSLEDYQDSLNMLKTEMNNLESAKNSTLSQISEAFATMKDKLEKRKHELSEQVESIYQERREVIVTHAQTVKSKTGKLSDLKDDLLQRINSHDTGKASELAQGLQSVHDIEQLCQDARQSYHCKHGFIRFHFEHGLQEYLMSIRGLGMVQCDSGLPSKVLIQAPELTASVRAQIKVTVQDTNGHPLTKYPLAARLHRNSQNKNEVILKPRIYENGVYVFEFMPQMIGTYSFQVLFNENPIWRAAKTLDVQSNNPVLIFGDEGSGPGKLNHPTSVAISVKGNIYVADMGNKRIQVFDSQGVFHSGFAVGGSKSTTYDVTINHASEELICSKVGPSESGTTVGNTIRVFGLQGEKLHNFCNPEMQRSMFVAVNSKGQIITSDSLQHCVYIFSKEGVPLKCFGSNGHRHAQFNFPSAVAVGKDDSILVCDTKNNRVQIFSKIGKFMRQLGPDIESKDGVMSMEAPRGISADTSHILVADSLNRILVFTWDMQLCGLIASEASPINEPYNLALTSDGHVFVADFKNNCIKKYQYR